MTNDTDEKFQELADAVLLIVQLRERIEQQAAMIAVALGYIQSGKPHLAAEVLKGAKI